MMGYRPIGLLLGATLAVALISAPGASAAPAGDGTEYVVELEEDGDAKWTIRSHFQLETEEERQAFSGLSTDSTGRQIADAFREIVASASESTGREMSVTGVSTSKSVSGDEGSVEVTLTWTGFADPEGESVQVGDVFPEGFSLSGGESLRIEAPQGYSSDGDTEVSWSGPDEGLVGTLSFRPSGGDGAPSGTSPGLTAVVALVALAGYVLVRD